MNSKNWRDCAAWRDEKLRMNTQSNEACKLYDAALHQWIGLVILKKKIKF
jgi:hypothetical protein